MSFLVLYKRAVVDMLFLVTYGKTVYIGISSFSVKCNLSDRMKDIILCGGLLEYTRNNLN